MNYVAVGRTNEAIVLLKVLKLAECANCCAA